MYLHECQGAECPHCSPFGLVRGGPFVQERRAREAKGVHLGWVDSTGMQVATYPKALRVSATVIIVVGTMEQRLVLCQQRRDNQQWGFPGGAQEVGESIVACAKREAQEETGLQVILRGATSIDSDPYHHAVCTYADGVVHYTNITFLANPLHILPSGAPPDVRTCPESLALTWVPLHRLPMPFLLNHLWRFKHAMNHSGPFIPVR